MIKNNINSYSYIFVLLLLLMSITMVKDANAQCGDTTITQNLSQDITNGTSCGDLPVSYFRAFDLNTFGIDGDFDVCAVEVGVSFSSTPIPQPITVNLYTSDPAFPDGVLTQIGTADFQISDSSTIVSVPVTGVAAAGSELVVEIFSPDGFDLSIGGNLAPETGPGYIQSASCGFPDISTLNANIIINAVGREVIQRNVPTLSEWGLIAMAGVLVLAGAVVLRRRKVIA